MVVVVKSATTIQSTMKIISKIIGGSHLYGLNTPESDIDERYIYASTDISDIIGLTKNECVDNRNTEEDRLGYEVRRYLTLLQKTNNQVIEFLYANPSDYLVLTPEFKAILDNRASLIDRDKLYKSLRGYMQGELRLANGERTGDLGGKRKAALLKYGFSPKNFVQLYRLSYCGIEFLKTGHFPVNIRNYNSKVADALLEIKVNPEKFTKEELTHNAKQAEIQLEETWDKVKNNKPFTVFDPYVANNLLTNIYYPTIKEHYEKCASL